MDGSKHYLGEVVGDRIVKAPQYQIYDEDLRYCGGNPFHKYYANRTFQFQTNAGWVSKEIIHVESRALPSGYLVACVRVQDINLSGWNKLLRKTPIVQTVPPPPIIVRKRRSSSTDAVLGE